jgi:AcrR family transcriptional regulator
LILYPFYIIITVTLTMYCNNKIMSAKYSRKINHLLDVAKSLFWKHGVRRVSVEEICEKAGVSKMTFYRHFENKVELARIIYNRVTDESILRFKAIITAENTSVSEKMEAMLRLKHEGTNEISREFLEDFYANPELGLADHVHQRSHEIWNEMIGFFRDAQEKGLFRKDFKPEALFIINLKMSELLKDEKLLSLYENPQDLIMEITRLLTYGIMPQNQK